jgi:hypothetical protein
VQRIARTKRETSIKAAHEVFFLAARNIRCRLWSRAVDDPSPAFPTPAQPRTTQLQTDQQKIIQLKAARPEFVTKSLIAMVNEDLIFDQRLF